MTFKPMPVLTAISAVSLIILITLGNWQYTRYAEKIANPTPQEQIETGERIELEIDLSVSGMAQQVYGFADSEPIWRRYIPARLIATGERVFVMVEATGGAQPVPAAITDFPETLIFEGVVSQKTPNQSGFAGRDDPENDIWYTLDTAKLATRLGLNESPRVAEPIIMTVRNAADLSQSRQTFNPYAFAKPVDPLPPERHFGYALTWWGMALGLIGVYVALHRARGRLTF
ncbi:MAG: SURF1 family cytochrome oxidase biogenesis protein [Pseudomonadota bacterium]